VNLRPRQQASPRELRSAALHLNTSACNNARMPAAPPADLRISRAQPSDIPLILTFIRKLASYEKLSHEVVADEDMLRESLFAPDPAAEVLLAYVGGEPVAFAVYFRNFSTFGGRRGIYLEDLFVEPAYRSRGIGIAIMAQLARLAKERGCDRLNWAVLDWNRPAVEFYRRMGAVLLDDWRICRLSGLALDQLANSSAGQEHAG
jgi:GNAT superfamily N-acetyltransferase